MKKYKIIGLSVLMTIFIVSNFVIGSSFDKLVNSNITSMIPINQANAEEYGNGKDGWCVTCYLVVGGEIVGEGMKMYCFTSPNHYCISQSCGYGFC